MKKRSRALAAIAALTLLLLAGCECRHEYDAGITTREPTCQEEGARTYTCQKCGESYDEAIPLADHTYTDRITREPTYQKEGERTFTCAACRDTYTEPIPALEPPVEVTVTGKRSHEDYFFDWVELDFLVENTGDRDIRGVRGELSIMDLFGKEIKAVRCTFTEEPIPAGESVEAPERPMLVSSFEEADVQIFETDFENLQFAFALDKVVYTEPDAPEELEAASEPMVVTVSGMYSTPADFSRGQVRSGINLTMDTVNNTGKEWKALEGTITIRDMFGDELTTHPCDLYAYKAHPTKEGWDRQTFSLVFFDITAGEMEAVYSDFEELEFEYTLYTILYEDGTREVFHQRGTSV